MLGAESWTQYCVTYTRVYSIYMYYTYIMPTSIRSRIYSVGDIASHSITCLRSVPVSGRHPDMSWWYPLIIYDIPFIEFLSPFTIQHFPKFPSFFQCFLGFFFPNDGFVDLEVSPNTSKYIFVGPVNSVKPPMIPTWICQGTWEARSGPGVALVFDSVIFPAAITSGYTPQTHTHTW